MFSKLCASAQGRVTHTRARVSGSFEGYYTIFKLTLRVSLVFTKKHGIYAARLMLRLWLAFAKRTYYTIFLL